MNSDREAKIMELAAPLARGQGLEIWGLELSDGPRPTVRLFVEAPGRNAAESAGEGAAPDYSAQDYSAQDDGCGIAAARAGISQCEAISRQLGLALDVEDIFPGAWTLEVSTPGLDRRFFRAEQLTAHLGDMLEVWLDEALPGTTRRHWRGRLLACDASSLTLEPGSIAEDGEILPEGEPVRLAWGGVRKAKRVPIFKKPGKPGKPARRKK